MKKSNRHILVGVMGAATMAFASCSSSTKNDDYATYPSSGYGNYGADSYDSGAGNVAATNNTTTGAGGGGAYPTTPQNYGTDYGSTGGSSAPTTSTSGQTHTVQRGETLYRIGQNYGTTVSNIKAANGLTSDLIRPGDVLVVR